jgi:hypothetical protein
LKKLETVEVELLNGDLIQIPVSSLKTAWGRYCASKRETYSGGRNGGITPEGYQKRLKTIAKAKKKK